MQKCLQTVIDALSSQGLPYHHSYTHTHTRPLLIPLIWYPSDLALYIPLRLTSITHISQGPSQNFSSSSGTTPDSSYWHSMPWKLSITAIHTWQHPQYLEEYLNNTLFSCQQPAAITRFHNLSILVCHLVCCIFTSTWVIFLQLAAEI